MNLTNFVRDVQKMNKYNQAQWAYPQLGRNYAPTPLSSVAAAAHINITNAVPVSQTLVNVSGSKPLHNENNNTAPVKENNYDCEDYYNENELEAVIELIENEFETTALNAQNKRQDEMLKTLEEWKKKAMIKKDPRNCKLYLKTGACQFGIRCTRIHLRTDDSTTIVIHHFFQDERLAMENVNEQDEVALIQEYEQFYDRLIDEFRAAGTIVMLKGCRNFAAHLRGNVYVQYSSHKEAMVAVRAFNGRYYAGKNLSVGLCPHLNWKTAICSMFDRRLCPRGKICGCLHVFRNPRNEFNVEGRTDFDPEHAVRFRIYDAKTVNVKHPVFVYYKLRDTYQPAATVVYTNQETSDAMSLSSDALQLKMSGIDPVKPVLIANNVVPKVAIECTFYVKTGACRFGKRCARVHVSPTDSNTVMIQNFFQNERLDRVIDGEEEVELIKSFENFYHKFVPEFRSVGTLINFKCCVNYVAHLRGNVYAQYSSHEEAKKAIHLFDNREHNGKRLCAELSPVNNWKASICGLFDKRLCPRGKACNFLHVFRNPGNAYSVINRTDFDPERASRTGSYDATLVQTTHPVFKYYKLRDAIGYVNASSKSKTSSRTRKSSKDCVGFKSRWNADDEDESSRSPSPDVAESNTFLSPKHDVDIKSEMQTKVQTNRCDFFMRTGDCKFGDTCNRSHEVGESDVIVIRNYFKDALLDAGTFSSTEEVEILKKYEKFYKSVIGDFRAVGRVLNFKCCLNTHYLRGNVYVHYSTKEEAMKAVQVFGKRGARLCPSTVANWQSSLCGGFDKRACHRGTTCNFLHGLRNPDNEYSVLQRTDFDPERAFRSCGYDREKFDPDHPVFKYYRLRNVYKDKEDASKHNSGYRPRPTSSRDRIPSTSPNRRKHSRSKSPSHAASSRRKSSHSKSPNRKRADSRSKDRNEHGSKFKRTFLSPSSSRKRNHSPPRDMFARSRSSSIDRSHLESYSVTIKNDREPTPTTAPYKHDDSDMYSPDGDAAAIYRDDHYRDHIDENIRGKSPRLQFLSDPVNATPNQYEAGAFCYDNSVGDNQGYLHQSSATRDLFTSPGFAEDSFLREASKHSQSHLVAASQADPYRLNSSIADPYRLNSSIADPFYSVPAATDSFPMANASLNQNRFRDDPYDGRSSPRSQFLSHDVGRSYQVDAAYHRPNILEQDDFVDDRYDNRMRRRSRSPMRRPRSRSRSPSSYHNRLASGSYQRDHPDSSRRRSRR